MVGLIAASLLVVRVNIAKVDGPNVVSDAGFYQIMRAVRRQYRRQADIKIVWSVKRVGGYETGQYSADVRQLNNYLTLYHEKYGRYVVERGRPAMLITPPLTDSTGAQYGGGAATLNCIQRNERGLGFAAVGDAPRQWELAPTLVGHELGHMLHAYHTTDGMMHANALVFVAGSKLKDRPVITEPTRRRLRACITGNAWYYGSGNGQG